MSISNRLAMGFGVIIVLMAVLGLFGLQQLTAVRETVDRIVERDIAMMNALNDIYEGQAESTAAAQDALRVGLSGNMQIAEIDRAEQAYRAGRAKLNEAVRTAKALADQFGATALSADRAELWRRNGQLLTQLEAEVGESAEARQAQFGALRQGQIEVAVLLEGGLAATRQHVYELVGQMRVVSADGVTAGRARIASTYDSSRLSTLAVLAIAVIIAVVVALALRRSIVTPVQSFMAFVERVGRGELMGAPAATGRDEVGRLGATLNTMVAGLRDIAAQSREATNNLGSAISEIRASTQEQAAGVEEQLAAVQETAATVDEITHAGSQVSKRAQEVIASAQATSQTSSDGMRSVDETARAMDAIRDQAEVVARNIVALSEKTQAVGEIIASVNDISERSHLLALNAAIEAAAAGENGRSFAVVASEMKVLADQAKDATGQVKSILGDIQRGINTSVMLTEEAVKRAVAGKERTETTQKTIAEITRRFSDSVLTFQQIVASTNQQQIGIEQVMSALQNIRQASQQTAAGTRQLNEAASNLSGLSQQLHGIAQRYKL